MVVVLPLRHVGDAGADGAAGERTLHVAAKYLPAARLDLAHPGHQRQQARLAYTIGADQTDHAAGRYFKIDNVQRYNTFVAMRERTESGYRIHR